VTPLYDGGRVEERALANGLGQPYGDYMRRTKRRIPYVF